MMYYTGSVLAQDNCPNPPVQQVYSHERYQNTNNITSHIVKHTDIIPSLSTSIWMVVVVMELWTAHPTQTRFAHVSRARAHVLGWWHPCRTARTSHVSSSILNSLSIVDLGHSSNSSTSQSWILIAVSPTVDGSLD